MKIIILYMLILTVFMLQSCCFPGKKEEIDVKDENWENKEEVVENSNNNQNVEQQNSTRNNYNI